MSTLTRRSAFAALAAALIAPVVARAQAPAGAVPSTTAPSNSEGTPAGGTGVVGGARVPGNARGPAPATAGTPLVGGEPGTSETTPRQRRRRRRTTRRHNSTSSTATPQ